MVEFKRNMGVSRKGDRVLFTASKINRRILHKLHTVNKAPGFPSELLVTVCKKGL